MTRIRDIKTTFTAGEVSRELSGQVNTAASVWSGLDHLEGKSVSIVADGAVIPNQTVMGGAVTLSEPASGVQIGLAYTHIIEPLPPNEVGKVGSGRKLRLIEGIFRIKDTSALVTQGIGLAVNEISRRGSRDQALEQLQKRQALQQQQLAQDAALERERIALNTAQSEEERKAALRRAVARQRANFGAQGVGSGAGSSQAVLLGLFEESDEEKARREELDALRLNAIDQSVSQNRSLNVLQRTQLQERNRLNNLTSGARGLTGLF